MRKVAIGFSVFLLVALSFVAASPAFATPEGETCEATSAVYKYEYKKITPGQDEQGYFQWRWLIERKEVKSVQWTGDTPAWIGDEEPYPVPQNLVDAANFDPQQYIQNHWYDNLPSTLYNLNQISASHAPFAWRMHYEKSEFTTSETSPFGAGIKVDITWVKTADAIDPVTEYLWSETDPGSPWVVTGKKKLVTPGTDAQWQDTHPNSPCYNGPVVVDLYPPQFVDMCGTNQDEAQIPSDREGVTYTVTWLDSNSVIVVASATEGHTFEGADNWQYSTYEWRFVFTTEECPVGTPPGSEEPTLANTGMDDNTASVIVLGMFLVLMGFVLWVAKERSDD